MKNDLSDLSMEEWQKLSDEVLNTDFDDKTLDYLFEKPSLCEAVRRYRLMKASGTL